MKRLLLLLALLLPSPVLAEGPLFRQKDTFINQEFENVYQDLRNARSLTATAQTAANSAQSTANEAVGLTAGKILQLQTGTSSTAATTTSASYASSNLSASITPIESTSTIIIVANGTCGNTASNANAAIFSIFRDSTNLGGSSQGLGDYATNTAVGGIAPCTLVVTDAPGDTSSHTYTVKMKAGSSVTADWGFGDSVQTMILVEKAN